jgi:hypothetical protein
MALGKIHRKFIAGCYFAGRGQKGAEGLLGQKEVLIYTSHWSWHCRRTRLLFQRKVCDFDVIDTTDDAELCALG